VAGTLLVRADAGPQIGTGHLMRSLALAHAWQSAGGRATFVTCCSVEGLRARIQAAGAGLLALERPHPDPADLAATLALLARVRSQSASPEPTWIVLDGYQFDPAYQQAIRRAGCRLLVIDDMAHLAHYHADLLLNQNLGAEQLNYPCDADTALLLGCRYALLRPEFQRWRSFRRETPKTARKLLVTLGGADPDNATATVIAALERLDLPQLEVKVMVGAANSHVKTLREQLRRSSQRIELLTDPPDVPELMAWADVAVSAAGSTCWELAFMQLPALLLVLAENQEQVARRVSAAGAATCLGRAQQPAAGHRPEGGRVAAEIAEALSQLCRRRSRRAGQSQAGRRLLDGRGADRVVGVMQALGGTPLANRAGTVSTAGGISEAQLSASSIQHSAFSDTKTGQVELRPATADDVLPLWRMANDPAVRRSALSSSDPIPLRSHARWFKRRLASPGSCIWVLDLHGLVLGQVRYDRTDSHTAEISISVMPAFRQRGLATRLLESTCRPACERLGVRRLRAIVRQENLPSARTFARAGFAKVDSRPIRDHPCHIYERYQ
jgi:UDP-2,4-diacetamido-2,4,6-trideoxy-beta-L-altropyranose hydrolase